MPAPLILIPMLRLDRFGMLPAILPPVFNLITPDWCPDLGALIHEINAALLARGYHQTAMHRPGNEMHFRCERDAFGR